MSQARCLRGHLIAEVGRTKARTCKECKREANRRYSKARYASDPEYRQKQAENHRRWLEQPENHERTRLKEAEWREKNRDLVRESQRIYAEAKRRERGATVRNLSRATPQANTERLKIPAGPFSDWLRKHSPEGAGERTRWARAHGIDESLIRRLVDGEQDRVHIDTVDKVVGPAVLNELYPVE